MIRAFRSKLRKPVVLRLVAEFSPPSWRSGLLLVSSCVIFAVFARWSVANFGHFFRPRADGLPG